MDGGTQTAVRPGNEAHWPCRCRRRRAERASRARHRTRTTRRRSDSQPHRTEVAACRHRRRPAASCRRVTVRRQNHPSRPRRSRKIGASQNHPSRRVARPRDRGVRVPGRTVPASRPGLESSRIAWDGLRPASAAAPRRDLRCWAGVHLDPSAARAASPPDCARRRGRLTSWADREIIGSRLQPRSPMLKTKIVFARADHEPPGHSRPL